MNQFFQGDIFVYSPSAETARLVKHARDMIDDAFAPQDPCQAQHHMAAVDFAALLSSLKPAFMHHPDVKCMVQDMLCEFGCDLSQTYFDIPRMRTMTHGEYLRSGIALAVPPHRDTWFAGPESQLNWWLPVMGVRPENTMVFHPEYFDKPVSNTSDRYDHDAWKRHSRADAARHVKSDPREYPRTTGEVNHDADLRIAVNEGGLLLFSGSQLHSTSANTSGITRFSIDFRTLNLADVVADRGAPNVDNYATGSTLSEYVCAADFSPLPNDVVNRYDRVSPPARPTPPSREARNDLLRRESLPRHRPTL